MFSFKRKRAQFGVKSNYHQARYSSSLRMKRKTGRVFLRKRNTFVHTAPTQSTKYKKVKSAYLIAIVVLLSIGLGTQIIFLSDYFTIDNIEANFDQERNIDQDINLTPIISKYLNQNLLLAQSSQIEKEIKTKHPQVSEVKINKLFPNQISIKIYTYEIVANVINKMERREKKFQILSSGYLLKEGSEDPALPYIVIKSETTFQPLSQIIPPNRLKYILEAANEFNKNYNMRIIDSEYLPTAREVHLRTEKNFAVWLDMEKPWEAQLNKLKRTLTKLNIYQTQLQYIDLRISSVNGDKVYYMERK